MSAFWHRILALVTASLLVLPLAVLTQSQYFCRMMDRIMLDRCCCHTADAGVAFEAPSDAPEVKAPSCCERVQGKHQKAAASLTDGGARTFFPVLAYVEPLDLSIAAPFVHLAPIEPRQARAPPPPPLKLFLKHCSLLT
ncbi:MAG TPA: hypothetical protein VFU02_10760 [Polyangiaceae bacterium]|nr:hypothetical protein [Polyangiaceae bacterium]